MSVTTAAQQYLVPWTRFEWPLDWEACFGRTGPLRVELGFGDGEFLVGSARLEPEANWVGVEISWFAIRRLLRRLEDQGIHNVRVIQADGSLALEKLFAADSLDAVVANHSDPWPKKRHQDRRLIQPRFLTIAAGRLRAGGRLTLATDHAEYAEWIARTLRAAPALRSTHPSDRVHDLPSRPSTKYERRGRAVGSEIHFFVWEKCREETRELPRTERIGPMPNVLLEGSVDFPTLLADWTSVGEDTKSGDASIQIRLLAAYLRSDGREWLVETRVDEAGFVQDLALVVVDRGTGRLLIRPAALGFPRPTPGVKLAVQLLAREILRRAPALAVVASGVGDPAA